MANAIPGWMWPEELNWLYSFFAKSRRHVEIGTYCGRSLLMTCAGFKQRCNVIAVDDFSIADATPNWTKAVCQATIRLINNNTKAKVTLVERSSVEAARAFTGQKLDSVFIDGNHARNYVHRDIELWTPLVRPGGIIAGHDYWPQNPGVMDAVNETGPFVVAPETRIWCRTVQSAG